MVYTVSVMESLIRSDLNEVSTTRISSAQLQNLMDEGYKHVAALALCVERETYLATTKDHPFVKAPGHAVTYIERVPDSDTVWFEDTADVIWEDTVDVLWEEEISPNDFSNKGLTCISPLAVGYVPIVSSGIPQCWFQWGDLIYIEPTPTDRYILRVFYSDSPTRAMSTMATQYPEDLPSEFHPCIPKYAAAMACIRLKRWADVAKFYNQYISLLQAARIAYIKKHPDARASHVMPDEVANA